MTNKPPSDAGSLEPRRAALRLLTQVTREGRMLSDARDLDGAVAARALRLAGLALRHLGRADALIAARTERRPHPRVQDILRLALAELYEDRAAAHGVVNDAVALTRMAQKTAKQAGLVNALLRQITAEDWAAAPAPRLPGWLRGPLAKAWGKDRVPAIEAAHLAGAPLDLTMKDEGAAAAWADRLGAQHLPSGSVRLPGGQVSRLEGYVEGAWWVQDAAAAVPVRLLGEVAGRRVLDLCAAPGGKTMQLAASGAKVTALDISDKRLERLRHNLARTGLAAEIVVADVLDWTPDAQFDAVLLDAPCSASGTIRRHPDLPYLRGGQVVEALTRLQYRMLDRALDLMARDGTLVYCTCSLLPVEGEHQITAALKRHPGLLADDLDPEAYGLPDAARSAHGLRLLPDMWPEIGGMDGFYMARMRWSG